MATAARVEIRRERHAGQRGVAAVRAAHDADALRIRDALGDQVLHAPGDVVLHLLAPLLVPRVEELLAVAGRGAEVRLQHRVAAVGEELRHAAVAPGVAAPRPAVRHHDERQVLGRHALRQGQVGRDLEPVGRRVADGLHRGERLARQLLADGELQRQRARPAIEQVGLARFGVARGVDDPALLVGRLRRERQLLARQLALEEARSRPRRPCRGSRRAACRPCSWSRGACR